VFFGLKLSVAFFIIIVNHFCALEKVLFKKSDTFLRKFVNFRKGSVKISKKRSI